jgi:hypothetical protein
MHRNDKVAQQAEAPALYEIAREPSRQGADQQKHQ